MSPSSDLRRARVLRWTSAALAALLAGGAPWTPSVPLFAGSSEPPQQRHDVGSHTSTGVVTSISDTTLVIRHADGSPLTFELTADTYRDTTVAVGVDVSVRYRQEGRTLIATAVTDRRRQGMNGS